MYPSYPAPQPVTQRRRRSDRYQDSYDGAQTPQPMQEQQPSSFQQPMQPYQDMGGMQPMAYQPMDGMAMQQMGYPQQQAYDHSQQAYYDPGMMNAGPYQQPYQPQADHPYVQQQDYSWAQPMQQGYPQQEPPYMHPEPAYMQGDQPYLPPQGYASQGYYGQPVQEPAPQQAYYGQPYVPSNTTGNFVPVGAPYYDVMDHEAPRRFAFDWRKLLVALAIPAVIALIIVMARVGKQVSDQRYEAKQVSDYVTSYDTRFCEGVYVDGIHLGGMTQEEGINAVTAQAQQRNSDWYVHLTYNGQTVAEINAANLGMKVEVLDVLRQAWQKGHESTDIYERQAAMQELRENPVQFYTAMPSGDTTVVDSTLAKLSASAYKPPQDAQLIGFDPTRPDPFTFQEGIPGRVLNTTALKEQIYQMVSTMQSGELELVPEEIKPNITVADLRKQVTLIADCTTDVSTSSVPNRNKNIERGCELLSGAVVQPGAVFSFNGRVGKRSIENGFYAAEEYVYGESTTGIGGGICQVSTTMYLAAVAANMRITDHTPHSMKANYTEYGMDATVYMDGKQIDFCFQNTSAYPIYIVASMPNKPKRSKEWMCEVKIYGMAFEEGVSYKLVSEEIELIPLPEPEYRTDRTGEYGLTYVDEEHVKSEGREGHVTQSYSVKYVNGEEVSRTALFKDTYKPAAPIIYRGAQRR